jgi:hypothetical protein
MVMVSAVGFLAWLSLLIETKLRQKIKTQQTNWGGGPESLEWTEPLELGGGGVTGAPGVVRTTRTGALRGGGG